MPTATTGLAVVIVILLGALLYFVPLGSRHDISVDGGFEDWSQRVVLKDNDGPRRPAGFELKEYALHRDGGRLCAYAKTSSSIESGSGARVVFLIDGDGDPATGYSISPISAESSMTIVGGSDRLDGIFSRFDEPETQRLNWSRWDPSSEFESSASADGRLEACLASDPTLSGARARVAVVGPKGVDDVSRCDFAPDRPCVVAALNPLKYWYAPGEDAFELALSATGGPAHVTSVAFDGPAVSGMIPSNPPWDIADGATGSFRIRITPGAVFAGTLANLRLRSVTVTGETPVTVSRDRASAYSESPPPQKLVVDGLVEDWVGVPDVISPVASGGSPFSADLKRVATATDAVQVKQAFLVEFHRPALEGTPVPTKHLARSSGGGGTVVTLPNVTGDDFVRAFIDSDNSTSTGDQKAALKGADRRFTVLGANGRIRSAALEYFHETIKSWFPIPILEAEVSPAGLEFGAPKGDLGITGPFQYLIEATDWSEVWDRSGGGGRDPMVVRPDGTGWRGDMGSWSGFGLPALAEGRNWVDISVARDGQAFLLRDDGEVYFTDGAGTGANWVRQTGTRPVGSGGVSWVGIDVRRNTGSPLATYTLRNDGLVISALTGTTGTAGAAWGAASSSSPPAGTAYVDIALSRQTAGLFAILRNDGGVFYSSGAAWVASPISGLTIATDYVSISALRGSCSGGATDNAMVVMRASGEVRCVRDPTNAAGTWIAYGIGGGGLPAAGSWLSLADDDSDDLLYAMRNDGVVYRSDGTGPAGSWSVAGGTGTPVPVSTAYVAMGAPGENAASANRAFVLRKNGEVYRNDDTSTNTAWNLFASGTPVPAGGGAWVSVGARDGVGAFLLAANGTVMRSDDLGGSWSFFADADPDYSWITIDVAQTNVYVMANDGWVERAPVSGGPFAGWNVLKTWNPADASWVSLSASFDGGLAYEVRALRSNGTTEIASELIGNWASWGDADAQVGQFNMVGIASDGAIAYAVSNTGAVSRSPTSSASWSVNAGAWTSTTNASFVDLTATESAVGFVWVLRNDGEILRSSDSANSFPDRGFLSGAAERGNAGYISLAAVPEASGAILAATAVLCSILLAIAFSRRRRPS